MELTEVESTNIYAMEQLQANLAGHGAAYFAHNQTAGKGQHGKRWTTEPGTHLAMTVVLDCSFLSLTQQFSLSVMAALATHDLFSKYAGEETRIKWPNDMYWRDRKAGGILIENQVRGNRWQGSVAGIGINLNQVHFPGTLPNPVSLKQITGKEFNPVAMAKELCENLETRYQELKAGGYKEQLAQYNELLFKRGQEVKLKRDNIVFNCIITGVSETGELLVSGGLLDSFRFGEVEWVLE
jgi:BirA family biotin operon repressor/biotin-[acetyl-CoA-carboxylase] ligase